MKVGDLAWFDSFCHKGYPVHVSGNPSDYAVLCVITKKYTKKEISELFGKRMNSTWSQSSRPIYDVLIEDRLQTVPDRTLIPMLRKKESI